MLDYILDALFTLLEAPYKILALGVFIALFYCAAMMIVGIPTSIWETVTKKKVNEEITKKIVIVVTILLIIAAFIVEAYQKAN